MDAIPTRDSRPSSRAHREDRRESREIAITGIGLLTPADVTALGMAEAIRQMPLNGHAATTEVDVPTDLEQNEPPVPIALVPARKLESIPGIRRPLPDKLTLMAIAASNAALEDAGLAPVGQEGDRDRVGVIANTCLGPNHTVERYLRSFLLEGPASLSAITFSRTVANAFVGEIARRHGLTGPSTLVAGSSAVGYAIDLLRAGEYTR